MFGWGCGQETVPCPALRHRLKSGAFLHILNSCSAGSTCISALRCHHCQASIPQTPKPKKLNLSAKNFFCRERLVHKFFGAGEKKEENGEGKKKGKDRCGLGFALAATGRSDVFLCCTCLY